jgi:acyl-CoA thioester hydrolase
MRIRIRWRDIDALGHVNNAVYLAYLEQVLTEFLGSALDVWVTTRLELDFRNELRLTDGEVAGRASLEHVDASGATISVVLARPDDATALEGRVAVVAWDPDLRRARPLTGTERQALAALAS